MVDEDAQTLVRRLESADAIGKAPTISKRKAGGRKINPMPPDTTFGFEGSKIWFRDKNGKRSEVPNGYYDYKGLIIYVKDGERLSEE